MHLKGLTVAAGLAAALWGSTRAQAEIATGFYSGGRFQAMMVDDEHVVVHKRKAAKPALGLPQRDQAALIQLQLAVIPRDELRTEDEALGLPVHFAGKMHAFGVLPRDLVLHSRAPHVLRRLRLMTGFVGIEPLAFGRHLYRVRFATPQAALKAANTLYGMPGVGYAHPNFILPKTFRAEDREPTAEPLYSYQWHLANTGQFGGLAGADLHVREAWKITRGDPKVLIALLDGGIDPAHVDLIEAWWHNRGEIPANGIDDDHDGYVDDVNGWNFATGTGDLRGGVAPEHGVATAGIVGARVNGKGITGVCPRCTLLPIVVAWTPIDDAAALYYAQSQGAVVISNSWGYPIGTPTTDAVREAIRVVGKHALIVFAMNNVDRNDCDPADPDISAAVGAIAVSASNDRDVKVAAAAWGPCLKLLAPSWEEGHAGVATTYIGSEGRDKSDLTDLDYTSHFRGTSASAPMVAGVFGLMLSAGPSLSRDEALALALATADKIQPSLAGYNARSGFSPSYGYGRINAERAVRAAAGL